MSSHETGVRHQQRVAAARRDASESLDEMEAGSEIESLDEGDSHPSQDLLGSDLPEDHISSDALSASDTEGPPTPPSLESEGPVRALKRRRLSDEGEEATPKVLFAQDAATTPRSATQAQPSQPLLASASEGPPTLATPFVVQGTPSLKAFYLQERSHHQGARHPCARLLSRLSSLRHSGREGPSLV